MRVVGQRKKEEKEAEKEGEGEKGARELVACLVL